MTADDGEIATMTKKGAEIAKYDVKTVDIPAVAANAASVTTEINPKEVANPVEDAIAEDEDDISAKDADDARSVALVTADAIRRKLACNEPEDVETAEVVLVAVPAIETNATIAMTNTAIGAEIVDEELQSAIRTATATDAL